MTYTGLPKTLEEQIDNIPPMRECFFHVPDEPRVQIKSMQGNYVVCRTKDGVHYVHATVLRPRPNESYKRWPEWVREMLGWWSGIAMLALIGWLGYEFVLAVRMFIDKLFSLFS